MEEVRIPPLGESINEGVIVRWLKQDGDRVAVDEPLLELETDKASVEIPAPAAGIVRVARAEGDTVHVGDTVARIEPGDPITKSAEPGAAARQVAAEPAHPPETRQAVAHTSHGGPRTDLDSLTPAVRRLVEENDLDPSSIDGTGRSGRITKADVLKHIEAQGRDVAPDPGTGASPTSPPTQPAAPSQRSPKDPPRESPPVRDQQSTVLAEPRDPRSPTPYPGGDRNRPPAETPNVVRTPMTRLRRRIAERLLEAQHGAAILTTFNEVDMSAILALRERFKKTFEERHGVRLGFMSFFARSCIAAMRDVPLINARIEGEDVVQPNGVHLGVAVGTERGLVVPVLHDADRMSFAEIEATLGRLADLAKDNKLSIADLTGGTFTISNGGVYGSLMSTPILNPPQSAILGMHKIEKRPVVVDDEIVIRPMMYLALSYDHRLIDGEGAVTFLVGVKQRLEAPERLLLDL